MRYLARRLVHSLLLLLGVSIFSFAILQLAPGDFFTPISLNPQISAHTVAALRSQYGCIPFSAATSGFRSRTAHRWRRSWLCARAILCC
jgi:ABC-type dipeptide/oligopeptide/nickel transport system permease component